ncbi:MAG: flagellar motor protein MotA [Hyphomicrobiales bacterium]|nr:MAG: flagellar motor protein MotA [Hyphomicrobiales bacterium]
MSLEEKYPYRREVETPSIAQPQSFLIRMSLFLVIAGFVAAILYPQISQAFMANPGLNGLIVTVLLIGIIFSFRQVVRLYPEIRWVNEFRIADPGLESNRPPVLLAPMATMLRDRVGRMSISAQSNRSLLDSIGTRLDEAHDISRYLIGLLVFLGLLGTFWGLLGTIHSVAQTIQSLDVGASESTVIFEDLKAGLEAPLKGMGTAFSSSLFGLAGSLVIGFLDLQTSQAQNRFYTELEDWLSTVTELGTAEISTGIAPAQLRFTLQDMQSSLDALTHKTRHEADGGGAEALGNLAESVESLVSQMRQEQKLVREWAQAQADQQADLAPVIKSLADNLLTDDDANSGGKD